MPKELLTFSPLERRIIDTLRYFDLFNVPLTATQIWRSLIVDPAGRSTGHGTYTLREIYDTLQTSDNLRTALDSKWGYWALAGREPIIATHLHRYCTIQAKQQLVYRLTKYLAFVPFIRMLGMSGSLAQLTATEHSDLDIFVIADHRRLWTARLWLLTLAQLLGRRRQYWDQEAPDKLCFNHYVVDTYLKMDPAIHNVYTAELYAKVVPLTGLDEFNRWQHVNASWLNHYLRLPTLPPVAPVYYRQLSPVMRWLRTQIELWLLEPVGDVLEQWAAWWQKRAIVRHTQPGRSGRVVVSATELAFHPDTKVPRLLQRYQVI